MTARAWVESEPILNSGRWELAAGKRHWVPDVRCPDCAKHEQYIDMLESYVRALSRKTPIPVPMPKPATCQDCGSVPVERPGKGGKSASQKAHLAALGFTTGDVRRWARRQDIEVQWTGSLKPEVVDGFEAALKARQR